MMVEENASLLDYNTFHLDVSAKFFITVSNPQIINEFLENKSLRNQPIFILGGGSNTLFTKDFDGVILFNAITGIEIVDEDDESVLVEIGAGENWHDLVIEVSSRGFSGIENLALIPGTVGGAAVQNIAAYGQNFEDVFVSLSAIDLDSGENVLFEREKCKFGYRDSAFKHALKQRIFITRVRIRLQKNGVIDSTYHSMGLRNDSLAAELREIAEEPYTPLNVAQAVTNIRGRKLIDPKEAPTVGSFFINPVITREHYLSLKENDTELQWYPAEKLGYDTEKKELPNKVKIPVGRLLDTAGWRGKQIGNVFISPKWASIITHNGKATGEEVLAFAEEVKRDVSDKYDISLETEVSIM